MACVQPRPLYIEFFAGFSEHDKEKALELAKNNVAKKFFVVGILEQFDETLLLFEKMLPKVFKGVSELYHSGVIQKKTKASASMNLTKMSGETRKFLIYGMLKYEYDLYEFTRRLFNESYICLTFLKVGFFFVKSLRLVFRFA